MCQPLILGLEVVEDLLGRSAFFDSRAHAQEPVEVLGSGDQGGPTIEITALDAAGEVRPEDYLPIEPRFRISFEDTSGVDSKSIEMAITGSNLSLKEGVDSRFVVQRSETERSVTLIFQPEALTDDAYVFEVSARDRVGNGPSRKSIAFQVSSDLRIERVLAYPNPMSTGTAFTYVLSQPSRVVVRVYTIAGRLIRVLEDATGRAGYNQLPWDGLDEGGHVPANGTYLYTVTADDGQNSVRAKEKLIIYR